MLIMKPSGSGVPAPDGKEWCYEFPVGVDCSDSEPRCIWLAALRKENLCYSGVHTPRNTLHGRLQRAKGQRDGILQPTENAAPGSGQNEAWRGPRTVVLQKNSQGFGFTLRHFIVYPPDSALHTSLKDVENGNGKGNSKSRLEPMDTIFVKNVRDTGPAHQAGLCTGDRLVKVNGESILGKTYSQVISLIQNSENVLELSIMPKDEDVLQLAYSQDAYLKGNDPYTGGAQNLPEPPPPVNYSADMSGSSGPAQTYVTQDNLNCRRGSSGLIESWPMGESQGVARRHALRHHRARSSTIAISPLDFHFANHNAAMASASLPHPRKGSLPHSHRELCQQALSNWYHSQTLDHPALPISASHRSVSQDALLYYDPPTRLTPPSYTDLHWTCRGGTGSAAQSNRSCSENHLSAYAGYRQNYDQPSQNSQPIRKEEQPSSTTPAPRSDRKCNTAPLALEDQTLGYRSYSPSFCRKAGHLMQQAHSFRDSSYTGPHLYTSTPKSSPPESAPCSARDSPPLPSSSFTVENPSTVGGGVGGGEDSVHRQTEGVVLRQKPNKRAPQVLRDLNNVVPLDLPEPQVASTPDAQTGEPAKRSNGNLQPVTVEQDSLASIPFIDDPISPSVELLAQHVPASSVVSSSVCQTPPVSSIPVSPSSTFPPLTQFHHSDSTPRSLRSSDQLLLAVPRSRLKLRGSKFKRHSFKDWHLLFRTGNVKNSRRSSYLLAITTERSKSCDEGLNTFRDEGRRFSRLPKRVKSFFTEGSLESLRAAEEARSKRHSTSELGNITLTDIRKEGWLHYKQILTEKGKKVGGGMRPWKRVFSVLRTHSLFLYKDKREAVLHGAGALGHGTGPGDDEQPISIRGCLIDIAYSETKRKHTLRLTTQDFCEYLLQAEDRDDMLSWIREIRENSKTDSEELGFSGQALINKKLNDYRKQSLTGTKPDTSPRVHRMMQPFLLSKMENASMNRFLKSEGKAEDGNSPKAPWSINIMKKGKKAGPKAFGVRLEDCSPGTNNKFVPLIVETCCSLVEEMGLEYTGIYRVPGNNAMVSNLQEQLNKGVDINTTEERWQDLNVISSLLKSFFRKLPEPLFTDDKYNDFIYANRLEDAGDRLKTMRKLIRDLPDRYYHTLKFLVAHLKRVADNSEKNKMEPRNLALVFGPTLVRTSEDNMTDMVTHMPDRYKIVETLILHYVWFFSDELNKDEKAPEDQKDEQPIPNIDHLLSNIGRTARLADTSGSTISESGKHKGSSSVKKDASAKDFLPLSIISAVTRKRKKHRSAGPSDSSGDEDSEHEPIKASNYREVPETSEGSRSQGQERRVEGNKILESCAEGGQEEVERSAAHQQEDVEPEEDGTRVTVRVGTQSEREKPQRPRSFLYSLQSSAGLRVSSESSPSPSGSPTNSGSTQRLGQANPTARKKLRGDRARPRSLYEEPALERAVGLARVKASLRRGQERLRQAMSPPREPPLQHSWLSQVHANLLTSANELWRSGTQRRHASPETRRRRRDWRRHTVVGTGGEV